MNFRSTCLGALFSIVCCAMLNAQLVDGIKAVVHDTPVTVVEVDAMSVSAIQSLERQYGDQEPVLVKKVDELKADNLDQLVQRQLILHEFKGYNVPETLLDKDVNKRLQEDIRDIYSGDRMRLIKTLQAEGITLERYKQRIREQIIVVALRQKNVSSEIIISPHKIESYYDAHKDHYKTEEEVKLRMIVLTNTASASPEGSEAKRRGEEIVTKLNEGASFAEMAGIYSQGSQRHENGDWGWVEKKVLRKELADAATALKPGEHSGVIETHNPDSYYIMWVEDKRPMHFKPLTEVRDDIEKALMLEERSRLEQQWIARLKKKTFVKYQL
jgi:peptidyl-prolyl cis-trans isomerase SurA